MGWSGSDTVAVPMTSPVGKGLLPAVVVKDRVVSQEAQAQEHELGEVGVGKKWVDRPQVLVAGWIFAF
jgi:hypothetical protein